MVNYDDRTALQVGLEALVRYNKATWIPANLDGLNPDIIEKYFKAEPYSPEKTELAKILIVAAKNAYLTDETIPKSNRERVAERGAEEVFLALEGADADFQFASKKIDDIEYIRRQKGNVIVAHANRIAKVKDCLKTAWERGKEILLKMGFDTIKESVKNKLKDNETIGPIISGCKEILDVIPDSIKQPLKEIWTETKDKAKTIIEKAVENLKECKVVKKVSEATQTLWKKLKSYA